MIKIFINIVMKKKLGILKNKIICILLYEVLFFFFLYYIKFIVGMNDYGLRFM